MALFLTIAEVAEQLGVSRHTIHRGIESGTIPVKKISSRTWRIPASWLLAELPSSVQENAFVAQKLPSSVATVVSGCSNSGATSPQKLTDITNLPLDREGHSETKRDV